MSEQVTVTHLLPGDLVEVSCTTSACNGCKGSAFCNTKGRTFKAWNRDKLPLEVGETIAIHLDQGRTIVGTLITLVVPLLLFPLCYYLVKALGLGEGASFLLALGGIGVGFLGVWLFFRKRQRRYMPIVARKQDQD